jgi:hypothetical protein
VQRGSEVVVSPEWFRRFGDIPGVSYTAPAHVDRAALAGCHERPEVHRLGEEASLWWPQGNTSASPVHRRGFDSRPRLDGPHDVVRHLEETLELPGEASDYHFAIQSALGMVLGGRRSDPTVLEAAERLAWLDIRLVQARPEAITSERADRLPDESRFYRVPTFHHLISLYEREGALQEALDVAEIAVRFEQLEAKRDEIAARLAALNGDPA